MAEHEDDLDVGSMRSVFSVMRAADEEPPMHGLAALMAAATAHAPKPQTWWQGVTHALRQPPVLALASIAILIGGALVISRPDPSLEAVAPRVAPLTPVAPSTLAIEPRVAPNAPAVEPRRIVSPRSEMRAAAPAPGSEDAESPATAAALPTLPLAAEQGASGVLALQGLFAEATSAAARGDCETARALATRVARQAPVYYRDHVATDAAVATCLNQR